ncbi:uncharacterized protein LOC129742470 [Uranotaenia lowii]|uniref:uncharacterized protein LOC129742470 n=1 Tax=Uranotaenia lowii TaxID=190385 RepID=UPI002479AA5B|nr:uncharacterized protein LOC129742470 [Uranotaenia lowii]
MKSKLPGAKTSSLIGSKTDKPSLKPFCGAHAEENSSSGYEPADIERSTNAVEGTRSFQRSMNPTCFICKDPSHRVKDCCEFRKLSVENRWNKIKELGICRTCLGYHGRRPCKSSKLCDKDNCYGKHHTLLHLTTAAGGNQQGHIEAVISHHRSGQSALFRMLPVTLYGNGKSIEVVAFIDDGSSMTLMDEDIAKQLDIKGELAPLCLRWTGNITRSEAESQRASLTISATSKSQKFPIHVRTVSSLNLPKQTVCYAKLVQEYPHIKGLPIQDYNNATPRILIGNDNSHVGATLKIREGAPGDPIASKCRLGWSIYGATGKITTEAKTFHICECNCDEKLQNLVKEFFSTESVETSGSKYTKSKEDERAIRIMEETTTRCGQRFETGLIWKYDDFEFPASRAMAERRLRCLERRMQKDPIIGESVRRQMAEYLQKGYIHKATEEELVSADERRAWYLPLGVALNPKKPSKIRIFCDAAARVDGVSLNDMLLTGPDLLSSLPGVLLGFRERAIAICADLMEMFHQVRIRAEDRNSQRLLWRKSPEDPIEVYFMDVATFGSTCSPSSAQFIKNRNAKEYANEYPEAAEAIIGHHYVDDWMDSTETVEKGVKLAAEVEYVHAQAGFKIHNWLSNSQKLLERIGVRNSADIKHLNLHNEAQRVLGMLWHPTEDVFVYSMNKTLEIPHPTKREVLRAVMSLFDPLGLLAFVVIHGKVLIQDIWRSKTNWDERIPEELRERWQQWTRQFEKLKEVKINRCYFPNCVESEFEDMQLHIFGDASEQAYACVAYLRARINGRTQCALVSGKTKVAPLKTISIPRLELQAAILGVRMAQMIKEHHRFGIKRTIYWTDSQTVLSWINSEHRRFRQYVACRVGEILTKTNAEDWRWLPSKENVADDATKWGRGPNLSPEARWFQGPSFLHSAEEEWPVNSAVKGETEEEMTECLVHVMQSGSSIPLVNWKFFSSWQRLWRAVATVLKYFNILRCHVIGQVPSSGPLTCELLAKAETTIFRCVQLDVYQREWAILQDMKKVKPATRGRSEISKDSKLFKLSPFLDEHGVIRLESRIVAASYAAFDTRYPIILPKDHPVTLLLVEAMHKRYLHANRETVVNEIRQRFHIPNLRSVVRKVTKSCRVCQIRNAKPVVPRMAPLPAARLQAFVKPFTFIGLDYFGPINVRIGRSLVKRWVALFTCLTIRAIHLEVVHSLTTESCKMAIRRFIVCHGSPLEIYSDNGTNFVGASNDLRSKIDSEQLAESFTNASTKWIFNPPSAPHMGGAWERLVRSVKVAMASIQTNRNPDEETFVTIVREAQGIVNSRPLTFIPIDGESQEALTPNHFIMLSSSGVTQVPKRLADEKQAHRNNWGHLNVMVDQFWRRWIKEYLPTISRRTKWFQDTPPIEKGDLVVIVNDTERNGWIRGRVIGFIEAKDGRRRQAAVQTSKGVMTRPMAKLARLDLSAGNTRAADTSSDLFYGRGDVTA